MDRETGGTKTDIIILISLTLIIAFAITMALTYYKSQDNFDTTDYQTKWHTVEKGETLWELGTYCKAEGDDVREWISAVKKLNGMSSSGLTAGDYIKIYVAK